MISLGVGDKVVIRDEAFNRLTFTSRRGTIVQVRLGSATGLTYIEVKMDVPASIATVTYDGLPYALPVETLTCIPQDLERVN